MNRYYLCIICVSSWLLASCAGAGSDFGAEVAGEGKTIVTGHYVDTGFMDGFAHGISEMNGMPITKKTRVRDLAAVAARVNRIWNGVAYLDWDAGYWATPTEFKREGGQCRDYAVAKYQALYGLGVADADMEVLGVIIRSTGQAHAVLRVHHGRQVFVLDNLHKAIYGERTLERHYRVVGGVNRIGFKEYGDE